jgi:hypothetical protein
MPTTTPQLWPIFICYRRVDGGAAARRLHEMLDKWQATGAEGQPIQLDVYLDETMPGIADWKAMHGPYLEKARAIVVVCTPGARINEGPNDWVHREIDWWLAHRETAPILVDPLKEGIRYVPLQIAQRWPDIQRIPLVEDEWKLLSGAALDQKTEAVRRMVIGAILPSGAAIYTQELAQERDRAERLKRALAVAEASLLDTRAASLFGESRLVDARRELELATRADIVERLASAAASGARQDVVPPGVVFVPFHYGDLGEEHAANSLTPDVSDPVSKQPVQKFVAVRVERLETTARRTWWQAEESR